ncbi:MAG: HD domain-containing phosphohydrolase, partial [Candidatus Latescibacterota bacterium]|nr:HD domain-containing phosphohydrolase [Candidatus Latescibacterota bacterium]
MSDELKLQVQNLVRIGTALSSERNIDVLLEMIVDESRRFTGADGGTLYVLSDDGSYLDWKILHNHTMGTRMGGASGKPIHLPPVPLSKDGQPNISNVCAACAHTGNPINIPDAYEADGYDFSGTRLYDATNNYRSKSVLVVPLRNHEDDIIGVLQLINAKDLGTEKVITFSSDSQDLVIALASQAAVAITNAQLIADLRNLFDAFIQATATAIDEKSSYTAGHVRRVADLTMRIAGAINRSKDAEWADTMLSADELDELRIAAWMHDVGKITTPEYVVDKSTKLETIYDRIEVVQTRWEILKRDLLIEALKQKVPDADMIALTEGLEEEFKRLDEELEFIGGCNLGGEFMADSDVERLETLSKYKVRIKDDSRPSISDDELYNLSIRKGTLTDEERLVIQNHAAVSIKILFQLPFSKTLKHVPEYAGGHHEKLNGKGYPAGLTADDLPLQARILAIADVFEAITAPDRPYREPMHLKEAMEIVRFMVADGELDEGIVDLFEASGVVRAY